MNDDALSLANLLEPEVRANPYPLYHMIQNEDPVHWDERMGFWVITRYEDALATLHDKRIAKAIGLELVRNRLPESDREAAEPVFRSFSKQMLYADPPYGARLRGLFNKAFTASVVEKIQPHIQEIADGLIDAVEDNGEMDLVHDYAYPLPLTVIAELLGLPTEDIVELKQWSDDVSSSFGIVRQTPVVMGKARQSLAEFTDYICALYDELEKNPKDDLLSGLIAAVEEGNRLDKEELVANVLNVLIGGHETTTKLISNGMLALMENREQLEDLRAKPELIHPAVEEILRYDSPVQIVWRVAGEDYEVGGKEIRAGQLINVMIGAASRDPSHYVEPDRFDIHRGEQHHLGFGFGSHFCVGSPLGRLDGQIAIATLLRRLPEMRLKDTELEWQEAPTFRGLVALPVAF